MKNLMSLTKLMSIAMLMVVVVGCDLGDSTGTASGSALPIDPLAGNWTIGLANTSVFAPGSADSGVVSLSIDHGLGNIVELLGITFDEVGGTVTVTSTECDISRTFDLIFPEDCEGDECLLSSVGSEKGVHAIIDGEWGPIESCDSEGTESGSFFAEIHLFPEAGKLYGFFESTVTVTTEGEVTTSRSGEIIGARDGLPASPPDPNLVNGIWTADVEGHVLANHGSDVHEDHLDFYVTLDFDQNGGVEILLAGTDEICLPGANFNYVFNMDMDDFDDFEKDGHGCIAGSFEIEDVCEIGGSLRGVLIADFHLECDDDWDYVLEELEGSFTLMLVGSHEEASDFSAILEGEINDGMRERPDVANESTLVGDWIVDLHGEVSGMEDGVEFEDEEFHESDVVWFNLTEMLQEFSGDPSSCSNLVSFSYIFNGADAEPQYSVVGSWNLTNTCEGDLTDIGTATFDISYDADEDSIHGSFTFEEHGTFLDDGEVIARSESGSGEFHGHRADCDFDD